MFKKLLISISKELGKKNIPYMIIGGQAVLLYGEPRLTRDIDITLGITLDKKKYIFDIINKIKLKLLVNDNDIEDFASKTMVVPVVEEKSGIRVDFIFSYTPYERQAIERARIVIFGKQKINFASPEDVIIHKIFAGREKDIEDVRKILQKQKVDNQYIIHWLAEFDKSFDGDFVEIFKSMLR